MKVEIWSDVVCPWCYIGKRRFERALARFSGDVDVVWRSFELDPRAPERAEGPVAELLARKYRVSEAHARAMMARLAEVADAEGLELDLEHAVTGNTFDAHRILHLAADEGRQDELAEGLFTAYFTERRAIGLSDELRALAAEAGLEPREVENVLTSDRYAEAVRDDEARAREVGAYGVPFFLFDEKYGVSGAQEVDTFVAVLERVSELAEPAAASGDACEVDGTC